jgi:hypothetical protein
MDKERVFAYLDALRSSGITNMFGAPPYVRKVFDVSNAESIKLVAEWMETFDKRHSK